MSNGVPGGGKARPDVRRFRKILIVNRGEVAMRILRACRDLGIAAAAVYSDADREAPHVAAADEAWYLGGSRATASYLDQRRILEVLRASAADAVHPGCGFLAENADFAAAVGQAGATFIGPSVESIRLMASKADARRFVAALGIPVIPGYDDADQSPARLADAANAIGYPVLVKAAAGGGGTGIRVVRDAGELQVELSAARREALSAFGDGRLIVERCFEQVRHVEVQVVADHYGGVVHCYDRECSLQRRRQKVIEEAPASLVDGALRAELWAAAVHIATAARYTSLGTVEFLVDDVAGKFYFLEMNTRLQVEHGVTEEVTGLDLVRWQTRLAEGEPLGCTQADIRQHGHAVECRLYAEDPRRDFAPATGRVLHWAAPADPGVRVDSSVRSGTEVTAWYDAMLAKLIGRGSDRACAIRAVRGAVARTGILGVETNQRFLLRALDHPRFVAGDTHTTFVDALRADLACPPTVAETHRALLVAALQRWRRRYAASESALAERTFPVRVAGAEHRVRLRPQAGAHCLAAVDDRPYDIDLLQARDDDRRLLVSIDGHALEHAVVAEGDCVHVFSPGAGPACVEFLSRFWSRPAPEAVGQYRAAITGRILEVLVSCGTRVRGGDRLITMESMKMEHATVAGSDGVVTQLWAVPGAVMEKGMPLIEIETAGPVAGQAAEGH